MSYVMVTGGQEAIGHARNMVQYYRLKDSIEELDVGLIRHQMRMLRDRVMSESGLYAPEYAALALKQAEGDPYEAVFLLRSYSSTLVRNHVSATLNTDEMRVIRRISAAFKDIPGGQILGPTRDYTHRLLDFTLQHSTTDDNAAFLAELSSFMPEAGATGRFPKVIDRLRREGMIAAPDKAEEEEPFDITRQSLSFPTVRSARLQSLSRGETGALVALAYSSTSRYGKKHPVVGELRVGYVPLHIRNPLAGDETDDCLYVGELLVSEVEMIQSFGKDSKSGELVLEFGYGLVFGHNEQKAIAMSLLEHSLERGGTAPAEDEQFVLKHIDPLDSGGIMSHMNLPHYVSFQSYLDMMKRIGKTSKSEQGEKSEHARDEK
ncbi:carbon-phosphorus lyase complex subunit PhnI [Paenibacillus periandrae]|uniref:carbon-phosphorus lyase complex subunit PhnI n=1 Tax=Paenibacillus periandrae TaxID=1761741 RepID=UPI001F0924ED